MSIDLDEFSGSPALQQMLKQVNELVVQCSKYINTELPPVTFSFIKSHSEQADRLSSDIVQTNYELRLAHSLKWKEFCKVRREAMEDAYEEYGKSRFHCEAAVDGEPALTDLQLILNCIEGSMDSLNQFLWIIKAAKSQAVDMFEKTK